MLVYRVEDTEGIGPYQSEHCTECMEVSMFFLEKHVRPVSTVRWDPEDLWPAPKDIDEDEFCGFETPLQFFDWFDSEDRAELNKGCFRLVIYEVDEVKHYPRQVTFKIEEAYPLNDISIDDFAEEFTTWPCTKKS